MHNLNRRWSAALLFLVSALIMTGCTSGLTVRSDQDPDADFSNFSTWSFFDQLGIEGGYNSPIYGEHFRAAIANEMSQRGYRQVADPDLKINVTFRADDKVKMSTHTRPYLSGAYYGSPTGAQYGSALGVGVAVGSAPRKVTEASVFIDMVDTQSDRMVWQGVAVIEANDKVAKQLRDAIYTAVNRVYGLYPHRAGS